MTASPRKKGIIVPRRFTGNEGLAHPEGRNVIPPEVSLPGPFVTARCRPALAAYPA